jgi:tRNA uridine 5-carboxymethylaminomethyl modification enzyme
VVFKTTFFMFKAYDVIVVGAGHAGCEAAAAAANMGSSTLLITMNMNTIAQMSCNPAMGGIAKGQIVREIDALGGYSGIVSDKSAIQFRMLNRSKGPAMWSPRTQNDRMLFAAEWRQMLENTPNLDFWQDMVRSLIMSEDKKRVVGVVTGMGLEIYGKTVVLTNGTFLNGIIHVGEKQLSGGRTGEAASTGVTEQLIALGFESGRMKTGTPPRIDGRSLDYSKMELQDGDYENTGFSFYNAFRIDRQLPCHITYTNQKVHDILKTGFEKSPMFQGRIKGLGPRYCPSIEDKINRFSERERHQLFVEPEGWNTIEIYLNGFSSSLPEHVQYKALCAIEGFENVKMFRPGYAIEYDYFPPTQLSLSLETKLVSGLFFAGQINGTTGYEEAACQGLIAGINANRLCVDEAPLILKRSDAYIGVLIDDLVTKGTDEPYRMFTSRSEYRILLRQDNADMRLSEIGWQIGLLKEDSYKLFLAKKESVALVAKTIRELSVEPNQINDYLLKIESAPLNQKVKLELVLSRPNASLTDMIEKIPGFASNFTNVTVTAIEQAEILVKYKGYLDRESDAAQKIMRLEGIRLSRELDYTLVASMSAEAVQKLNKFRPETLGQAARISGISPSDISCLLVHLGK